VQTVEEIAYREAVRALEGQAQDLENYRSHTNIVLTAGGVAIAVFATQRPNAGDSFIVAAAAFGVIAIMTVVAYWAVQFAWDFDAYDLVNTYVDAEPPVGEEYMMRELAVHAGDDYLANRGRLDRLRVAQSIALLAFVAEVLSLLYHLAWE
jgi:hypothetical protein